jgi:hypothetical protein
MRHLSALAGNASMCAIGRSGQSFPAAKYHEGRQAAAAQLLRSLRRADPRDGVAELDAARRQWTRMGADMSARGPDWVAYAAGGLDALSDIADVVAPTHEQL